MALAHDDGIPLEALKFSQASEIVELVVLTVDDSFLQTFREAVGGARRLWHVPSADKVPDLLVAGEVGIVVVDATALSEAASVFVAAIMRQFPDLVLVVAGNRDAEVSLAPLISAGFVYRFIHKPVSPARARLFVEAAVRKYGGQRGAADKTSPRPPAPRRFNALNALAWGTAVLCVMVLALWLLHGMSREAAPGAAAERTRAAADSALLARAAAALAANNLTSPAGDNALDLYRQASARNPTDANAKLGLAEVRERLLAKAENALLEERLDEAATDIETAHAAGVEQGRIAFLSTQLVKARERLKGAQAALRGHGSAKAATAAPAERIAALLELANLRLDAGQLVEPERDCARYYLDAAWRMAPDDDAVAAAKERLALRLLAEVRGAIDRRDFARAEEWLRDADGVAAPANIETSEALLVAARRQAQSDANAQLLKNALERLQQDHLIEPANDSAKYYLATLRDLDPGNAGLTVALQELGSRLVAKARLALTLRQYSAARSWLDEANALGFTSAEATAVAHELELNAAPPT